MIKKLFILSLFLLTSISLCLASEQIIFGGVGEGPGGTEYSSIIGQSVGPGTWLSNIKDTQGIISAAGVLSDFYMKLNTAPGAGESRTFTIMIDESATSMTVTFSDADTEKSDTVNNLNISVGERITLRGEESSTGATEPINISWSFKWTPTANNETIIVGGTSRTEDGRFHSLYGASRTSPTEFDRSFIVPTNGTIKKLYVWQEIPPSGTTSLWTIRKDGSPTSVTAEIADGQNTANSGANSFSVTAGETLSIITTSTGSGGAAYGCIFVPDNTGEFIIAATSDVPTTVATRYQNISAGDGKWDPENIRNTGGGDCTIKKLYVKSEFAVGTGDTLVFTLRINGADSSPLLTKTLSQTESSGNVSADVSVANFDLLSMEMVSSESNTVVFSFLGFIPPPTKIQGATIYEATLF